MEDYAVELRGVSKRFTSPEGTPVVAVDDVTLRIRDGEFFSLLGPSGCGKTTSLRLIAGFEQPSSGEVVIAGRSMGPTPPFQRPVNTVFQSYALFPHMNVANNVSFGLEMKHTPKGSISTRVGDALAMVRLPGMENRYPKQLSGGQQQRVALARALVNRPRVLLLDEPLGALDLKLRKEMQLELKTLQREVGITFVYVTHDQEEALTMSDRIAVMNGGRVLQIGSPTDIYERPASRFVADFIGETNFLPGTLARREGERAVLDCAGLAVFAQTDRAFSPGEKVTIAIRPEKIRLHFDHPEGVSNCFPARIKNVVYVGTDTRFEVQIESHSGSPEQTLRIRQQNASATSDPSAHLMRSGTVFVSWTPESAQLLEE